MILVFPRIFLQILGDLSQCVQTHLVHFCGATGEALVGCFGCSTGFTNRRRPHLPILFLSARLSVSNSGIFEVLLTFSCCLLFKPTRLLFCGARILPSILKEVRRGSKLVNLFRFTFDVIGPSLGLEEVNLRVKM